ncbi:GNAT family N-acetyltransferase [Pseudonocardia sp. CA-107938]|uniref:GNAT family N-acetyltransferase n=1 Tax=Pseudonocardia sp. CA-107938 TaxID=3240021 RepID=UPI003D8B075B
MRSVDWPASRSDLVTEWDDLVDRTGAMPMSRPGWFAAWWRAFGQGTPQILRVRRNGRLAGVLPIAVRRGRAANLHNWHTFLCSPLAEDADVEAELVDRALRSAPFLSDLGHLSTPSADLVEQIVRRSGGAVRRHVVQRSPYVPVTGTFEEFLAARATKFVARIRQRRRKLEKSGELRLDVYTGTGDSAQLDAALDEAFAVEGMGWKGENGTAILSDARTAAFYRDVAHWAAGEGILHVTTLRQTCGDTDRAVAVELALDDGRAHYGLKVGFDPEFRAAGPGFILAHDLLQSAFERGLESFEFLGSVSEEKLRWTEHTRRVWHVRAFPGSVGGRSAAVATAGWRAAGAAARRLNDRVARG